MPYYKILSADLTHNDFKYQLGLNVDSQPFDDVECQNGLHFADEKNIYRWLSYGDQLAYVSIPPDARVVHFGDKSKADKIIIDRIIPLAAWHAWEDPEFCLAAVRQSGKALYYIVKQTRELCLEAIKKNAYALKYVKHQTEELCLAAVRRDGFALQYVHNQTPEICLAAVQQYSSALSFVHEQTQKICLAAVQKNGLVLKFVKHKTQKICLAAVRQNFNAWKYARNIIINPSE